MVVFIYWVALAQKYTHCLLLLVRAHWSPIEKTNYSNIFIPSTIAAVVVVVIIFSHLLGQTKSIKWKSASHVSACVCTKQTEKQRKNNSFMNIRNIKFRSNCGWHAIVVSARVCEVCGVDTRVTIDSLTVQAKTKFHLSQQSTILIHHILK